MIDFKLNINKGLWHVNFYSEDAKGKRKRKQLSTGIKAYDKYGRKINKRIAEEKAQEIVSRYDGIVDSEFASWSLDKCAEYCLEINKVKMSPTTYNDYLCALNKHIKPYFKNGKALKEIRAKDIETFCSTLIDAGKSPKTVHKMLSLIGPAFRYAEKNDFILRNPMRVVDKPSKIKKESSYYNAEQLNTLAREAKGSYIETPVILAMVLGLRRSEIVGITWENVDFDNRLLHIKQSVIVGDSSILPKDTYRIIGHTKSNKSKDIILKFFLKTDSSERSFILNDALYSYLKALKAEQENMIRETNAYKDFLCVNAVGNLITPDCITRHFAKLLDENGLPHIKFHALRHSCISLLANNTAFSMKQIQDYAGHSDFLTTFNVYSHSDESAKKNEMDYITSCFTDLFDSSNEE
ncbi:tyrosine-type recombinase/integrase [Ruminococcus flavefaciens]|uniref:tyrosine-type recombinase/integrase n=1 Tax=Ruminococcus flavefaciens TaxID=1265 RepID=UPI0026EA4601|nr:site-specific integrase [Ruminococcus flavefaciens]MDD7518050.1 site-specific integrase [Ruminococcus flavefaciens]MDY5692954.1 site-specific integrase [Ruminococcus flavefaciens]